MSTPSSQPAAAAPPGTSTVSRILRRLAAALTHRDFRILWLGAASSTIGTWVQKVAQNWLVLSLSGSAFYLGLDAFLGEAPILLFTLIGGVVADRYDRRYLLIASQIVQMACAFALMSLVLLDRVEIWHILALSFTSGTAQAFGGPAYQSLIPTLIPRADLPNAIALNSIQFNLARVIGPLVAGVTLAALGTAACFGLNGASFLAVIAALWMVRAPAHGTGPRSPMWTEMRSGLRFVKHEQTIVALTMLAFLATFLGLPLLTFLPVIAREVFHTGVGGYSVMMAWSGAGAVTGALVVAWMGKFPGMGRLLLIVQAVFAILVAAFAFSPVLWLSNVLLFFAGSALIIVFSLTTSLVQLIAPDDMRGRVMSIYMVAFRGGMPLGSLASGYFAAQSSAPTVLAVNAVLLLIVTIVFMGRDRGIRDL